jgi:hypothetical protein
MSSKVWSDRPLGGKLAALVGTARSAGRIGENDAQSAIDEVARMATSLHSSVARFRY